MFDFVNVTRIVSNGLLEKWNPGRVPAILYFHRVLREKSVFYPDDLTLVEFDKLMRLMSSSFEMSSLDDIQKPPTTRKMRVAITFDDGYRDNLEAAEIMKKYAIPCTFFVSTKGVEEGILWQDKIICNVMKMPETEYRSMSGSENTKITQRAGFAQEKQAFAKRLTPQGMDKMISDLESISGSLSYPRLMMTEAEVKSLSLDPLFTIGGHTHSHAILTTLSGKDTGKEIASNKKKLEKMIEKPVTHFAYPNGRIDGDIDTNKHPYVLAGFSYEKAYTTEDSGVKADTSPFLIPRFMPYRKNPYLRVLSVIKIAGERA